LFVVLFFIGGGGGGGGGGVDRPAHTQCRLSIVADEAVTLRP
jgi:hypothetical protein